MKLVIQIPCYNEETTIEQTLIGIPRTFPEFDEVVVLVIDDGSDDRTSQVASSVGALVEKHTHNRGLAAAFQTGVNTALHLGADVIVNMDGDNQYPGREIPKILQPLLDGEADVVIGERPISRVRHFSVLKKLLQRVGSAIVRLASGTDVVDAPSGFRAFTRQVAERLNFFGGFTYTLEMIIQAGRRNMRILSVPIEINEPTRKSRLIKSTLSYVLRSVGTIVRIFVIYKPFPFFFTAGLLVFLGGVAIGIRFLVGYVTGGGQGMVQSLILGSVLLSSGFQTMLVAFLSDQIAINRRLLEDLQVTDRTAHAETRKDQGPHRA